MKVRHPLKHILCFSLFSLPLLGQAEATLPDVACRYEAQQTATGQKRSNKHQETWYFWRQANSVQTRDADGDHGEIWQRSSNGSIQYRKLYHEDKVAIEHMPADQTTDQLNQDWYKLSSMLSQQELDNLKLIKKTKALGHDAELRKGEKDGKQIEVVWLVDQHLPASIISKDRSGSVELHLAALSPLADAPWQPIGIEQLSNYRHIDAVDFGDMENDPFVKKIMAEEGHHHPH